ncbi:transporter [Planctomycetales bacterium]|nr:transporter [Planctomycetales bacterium]
MERNPSQTVKETSWLAKPLFLLTRLCCRNAVTILVLAVCSAAFSVYWATEHLGFKMSRLDLINPNSSFNRLWLDYIKEFGDNDEVIIVAEGKNNAEIISVLEKLSSAIEQEPQFFQSVLAGVDLSKIRKKGLHYVPVKELQTINEFVQETTPLTNGHWEQLTAVPMLNGIAERLEKASEPEALFRTICELDSFSMSISQAFGNKPSYGSPWNSFQNGFQNNSQNNFQGGSQSVPAPVPDIVAACSQNDTNYFIFPVDDGVMGFVLLKLANIDKAQITQGQEAINKLRSITKAIGGQNPAVKIGLTGMPIIENDEMRISGESMTKATVLAFFGVAALFAAGFGGIRHPLFGMIALVIAFCWTVGYITVSVGHLNILSISFGTMLVGLGTDFSVHYVARYLQFRRSGLGTEESLCQTALQIGPGILVGAVTTAIAFYAASFTEFTGIAELGVISGGGIIFCVIATLFLLPAMIQICDRGHGREHGKHHKRYFPKPMDIRPALVPVFRFPALIIAVAAFVSLLLILGIPKVWYDYNLLHLQPVGLESVELEERLLAQDVEKGGKNVWFALSIASSKEELLEKKKQFAEKCPELTVEEIVSWFPDTDPEKKPVIKQLAETLKNLPERPAEITVSEPTETGSALARVQRILSAPENPLFRVLNPSGISSRTGSGIAGGISGIQITRNADTQSERNNIPQTQAAAFAASLQQKIPLIIKRLSDTREALRSMPRNEYTARMMQYQSAVAGDLLTRLQTLRDMAEPEPPSFDDLPPSLVQRFVSKGGKYLMRIYTTANIWNMDEMKKFVSAVRSVDPKATGSPLQTYEASLQMQESFIYAAFYAFGMIVLFLLIDFRSLKDTAIALMPMLAGFILMFGILGWLNIPLNPANMIVLPLILGLGIDDGVHLMHEYRQQCGRCRKTSQPYKMSSSLAVAILITSLTTLVGFGSMMIASHRGLQSLGRVLVIGVTCCLMTSLTVLPALFILWSKNRTGMTSDAAENEEPDETLYNRCAAAPVETGLTKNKVPELQLRRFCVFDNETDGEEINSDTEKIPEVIPFEHPSEKQAVKPKRLVKRNSA